MAEEVANCPVVYCPSPAGASMAPLYPTPVAGTHTHTHTHIHTHRVLPPHIIVFFLSAVLPHIHREDKRKTQAAASFNYPISPLILQSHCTVSDEPQKPLIAVSPRPTV